MVIDAIDLQSLSELTTPVFGQVHTLLVASVQSNSDLSAPTLVHIAPAGEWEEDSNILNAWNENAPASTTWTEDTAPSPPTWN